MRQHYRPQKTGLMDDCATESASRHRDNEIRRLLLVVINQPLEVHLLLRYHRTFLLQSEEVRSPPYPGFHLGSPRRVALLQMYSELELQGLAPSHDEISCLVAPSMPPLSSLNSAYVLH